MADIIQATLAWFTGLVHRSGGELVWFTYQCGQQRNKKDKTYEQDLVTTEQLERDHYSSRLRQVDISFSCPYKHFLSHFFLSKYYFYISSYFFSHPLFSFLLPFLPFILFKYIELILTKFSGLVVVYTPRGLSLMSL